MPGIVHAGGNLTGAVMTAAWLKDRVGRDHPAVACLVACPDAGRVAAGSKALAHMATMALPSLRVWLGANHRYQRVDRLLPPAWS